MLLRDIYPLVDAVPTACSKTSAMVNGKMLAIRDEINNLEILKRLLTQLEKKFNTEKTHFCCYPAARGKRSKKHGMIVLVDMSANIRDTRTVCEISPGGRIELSLQESLSKRFSQRHALSVIED